MLLQLCKVCLLGLDNQTTIGLATSFEKPLSSPLSSPPPTVMALSANRCSPKGLQEERTLGGRLEVVWTQTTIPG